MPVRACSTSPPTASPPALVPIPTVSTIDSRLSRPGGARRAPSRRPSLVTWIRCWLVDVAVGATAVVRGVLPLPVTGRRVVHLEDRDAVTIRASAKDGLHEVLRVALTRARRLRVEVALAGWDGQEEIAVHLAGDTTLHIIRGRVAVRVPGRVARDRRERAIGEGLGDVERAVDLRIDDVAAIHVVGRPVVAADARVGRIGRVGAERGRRESRGAVLAVLAVLAGSAGRTDTAIQTLGPSGASVALCTVLATQGLASAR